MIGEKVINQNGWPEIEPEDDPELQQITLKAAYLQAARYYLEQEQPDKALKYYRESPGAPDLKLAASIALALFEEKQLDEALELALLATDYELQGRIFLKLQRLPEATEAFKQAIPQKPEVALRLADTLHGQGQNIEAMQALLELVKNAPTLKNVQAAYTRLMSILPELPPASASTHLRVAITGSSTLDDLQVFVEMFGYAAGLRPEVWLSGYDQYRQDILDPESELYAYKPDVIIIKLDAEQVFGYLERDLLKLTPAQRREAAAEVVSRLGELLETLMGRLNTTVLINNFALPEFSPLGIADRRDEFGQAALYQSINDGLAELIRLKFPTVFIVDEARLASRIGGRHARDDRMWYIGRIGLSEEMLPELAGEYTRYLRALKGKTRKCLVVDLDNTMWGGIVGEDGPEGLQLGNSGLGNAFSEFQHALLQLSQRGFLLAVASKNNPADALEVLEKHPDMVLRPDNFACLKINWQDKPSNLREIARELNIGIDSLVFLDDNPVERSIMRQALPEVLTVELPSDPALYRRTLLELPEMDVLQVTEEDLARARMYHEQQARDQFQKQLDSSGAGIEKFLWDLQQRVIVARADNLSLPRIAQLINKTNQFNLTTIRYTEAQVREMAASTQTHRVYGIKVIDRFGDNGLTGVAIIETGVESWRIDTLLLSCRVMGRTVETALLNYLMEQARASGATLLEGEYRPTAKNSVVARLYPEHGFSLLEEKDNNTRWGLELTATEPQIPGWIKFEVID